ncbi:response regulator transcription factor [Eubacterium multiforme]|uniref:Stage 0 sporulation protein A homolog n=1 Tax=Eubacterium multiforme TaxID=83339 RepID=A0ABT9UY06_9FIRM|nr:response regulator transcription factor [Eubacterium multiforme]MDQ0151199.1 DNA-binding response OmpR family regulator [Eubacterium multiforme]
MEDNKRKILVVEDDQDINNLIFKILNKEGYEVVQAFSGSEGRMCLEASDFDLILLDLMLPGMSGEDIIQKIRLSKHMPIIVISAKASQEDKINVLKIGADDFVSKPFDVNEVLARVEAQLRRYKVFQKEDIKEEDKILTYKEIVLDKEKVEVKVKGELITLTAKEYLILKLLMSNSKKVFTRANLFKSVWGEDFLADDNTINVHISNIRSKIHEIDSENEYIKTIWGIGFKLD